MRDIPKVHLPKLSSLRAGYENNLGGSGDYLASFLLHLVCPILDEVHLTFIGGIGTIEQVPHTKWKQVDQLYASSLKKLRIDAKYSDEISKKLMLEEISAFLLSMCNAKGILHLPPLGECKS